MRHGQPYAAAEGFDARFDALVAEILPACIRNPESARQTAAVPARAGQMSLSACRWFARHNGYADLGLLTRESHRATCAPCEINGFRRMPSRPMHSFGQPLVEQQWQITLSQGLAIPGQGR